MTMSEPNDLSKGDEGPLLIGMHGWIRQLAGEKSKRIRFQPSGNPSMQCGTMSHYLTRDIGQTPNIRA
jgi:hypothetical protein